MTTLAATELTTLRTVQSAIQRDAFADVVRTCRAIVQKWPSSATTATTHYERLVWYTLVVALLHENHDDEALRYLEQEPYRTRFVRDSATHLYALAYALYRAKRPREAIVVLQELEASVGGAPTASSALQTGIAHLCAQATYRAEQHADAVQIYEKRFTPAQVASDVELASNVLSALLSAGEHTKASQLIRQGKYDTSPATYEVAYNAACCLLEQGNLSAALTTLDKAIQVCRDTLLNDGFSDAEVANESAVLLTQKAFVLQLQNRIDDAVQLYQQVLDAKPSDPAVTAVACTNLITVKLGKDHSDAAAAALLKHQSGVLLATTQGDEKLTSKQKPIVQLNRCLVWLHAKHVDKCKAQLDVLLQNFPHYEPAILVQASLLTHQKKHAEADRILETFIQTHSNHSATLHSALTIVQLRLARGDLAAALDALMAIRVTALPASLSSSPSAKYPVSFQCRPATVALIVALNERLQRVDGVTRAFERAIDEWQHLDVALASTDKIGRAYAQNVASALMEHAADYFMLHGRVADATVLLKRLAASGSKAAAKALADAEAVNTAQAAAQAAAIAQANAQVAEAEAARMTAAQAAEAARVAAAQAAEAEAAEAARAAASKAAVEAAAGSENSLGRIAKLVLATASVDPATAISQARLLPTLSMAGIDVTLLERTPASVLGRRRKFDAAMDGSSSASDVEMKPVATAAAEAGANTNTSTTARPAKRNKRPRYPKGFDPANPGPMPDPERWLPKWERTSFKKKFKRQYQQQQNSLRGSQGSTAAMVMSTVTTSGGGVIGNVAGASSSSSSSSSSTAPVATAASTGGSRKKGGGRK